MQHLKQTQGIDRKSKSYALKGICEFMLKDALTGKIVDKEVKENMLTNGLSSFYNGCPYALDKPTISGGNFAPTSQQVPVNDYGLGGVILFPQALGNDPDILYPDFASNPPTGFASKAAYVQTDSRQGAYDGNSSHTVANGFLNVYSWGSAFGNGTIASVALSHVNCYKFFDDLSVAAIKPSAFKSISITGKAGVSIVGANSKGVFFNSGAGGYGTFPVDPKLLRWKKHETKLDLLIDPFSIISEADEIWQYPGWGFFCIDESYAYFLRVTTSAATSAFTLYTIDLSDNSVTSSNYTVAAYIKSDGKHDDDLFVKKGNYVYLFKYDGSAVYKIDLTDTANFDEITLPVGLTNPTYNGLSLVKGVIIGNGFVIGADDVAIQSPSLGCKIVDAKGVWAVINQARENSNIGAAVMAPFCATHADLGVVRTKTAGQELIVNYTVLQV